VMRDFPRLLDAWDRGRHLRAVRGLAAAAASFAEASHVLDLTEEQFAAELDQDAEVRDIWNQARIETAVRVKAAMVQSAAEGKVAAINNVVAALRRDVAQPRVDWHRLTMSQAEEATGKSRQTLHAWYTKQGAPINADRTWSLPALVDWMLEDWALRRAGAARPAAAAGLDPLKQAKAEMLQVELDLQRGRVLDRQEVLAGLVARHQTLVSALARKETEMSTVLANQPAARIEQILRDWFGEIRRTLCQVPDQLRLPPPAAALFAQVLDAIGEGTT